MTSHGRHGVLNHEQLDCLFSSLFRLTATETYNLRGGGGGGGIHRWPLDSGKKLATRSVCMWWRHYCYHISVYASGLALQICKSNPRIIADADALVPIFKWDRKIGNTAYLFSGSNSIPVKDWYNGDLACWSTCIKNTFRITDSSNHIIRLVDTDFYKSQINIGPISLSG